MNEIDWTTFNRRIAINSEPLIIFNSWTSQSELQRWFLKEAIFFKDGKAKELNEKIEKGDTYKWSWHGSDHLAEGEILEFDDSGYLKFTFLGNVVSIQIKEESNQQILDLVQSDIGTDEESKMSNYVGCTRGWTFYMTNLKSILEGGIDLRNKSDLIQGVINT